MGYLFTASRLVASITRRFVYLLSFDVQYDDPYTGRRKVAAHVADRQRRGAGPASAALQL